MMDWNGDGRVNSMDTYDMIRDTSNNKKYARSGSGSGGGIFLAFLKQILIIGVICLIISTINPALAKILIVGFLVCKVAFP